MSKSKKAGLQERAGRFVRIPAPTGFHAVLAHNVTFPAALNLVHGEYAIKVTTKGRGAPIYYRGLQRSPCSVGEVTVLAPFEPIVSETSLFHTDFVSLLIEPSLVQSACEALGHSTESSFQYLHLRQRDIADAVAAIGFGMAEGEPGRAVEERLTSLLECLLDDGGSVAQPHGAVQQLREIILDRLAENVGLEEIERECGLSRFHLLRSFRMYFGMPPHKFRTHARVAVARKLLAAGRSQAEAALEVGFFDQNHLHRYFRRILGVSPGGDQRSFGRPIR